MLTRAPKGTKDILPEESFLWHYIEDTIRNIAQAYGYKEIRTPVFEHTELFVRGVGNTTDIVQKEMYTFLDKAERSITLKPEGTAGVVRAFIEHKMYAKPQPTKMYYITPCYRYERPQAGRLREFHQFGIEVFGSKEASIDAEIILLALNLFSRLGISNLSVNINSIGCPQCRPVYHNIIKEYLSDNYDSLCGTCKERFEKNPLRILDCKEESCKSIIDGIPHIIDYLCDECDDHFENLKRYLNAMDINYKVDPMIVRGLDYYTKTVFEIISDSLGAQSTVCGGGRYDGLVSECGGPETPGVGFGLGLERLVMIIQNQNLQVPDENEVTVFITNVGDEAKTKAFELVTLLRENGVSADMDHLGRSLKAQFKYANKIAARWVCTLGENEIQQNTARVKNMGTGEEEDISLDEFISYFKDK